MCLFYSNLAYYENVLKLCVADTYPHGTEIKDTNLNQFNIGVNGELTKINEICSAYEHTINLPANYKDRITTKWPTKLSFRENNHDTDNTCDLRRYIHIKNCYHEKLNEP